MRLRYQMSTDCGSVRFKLYAVMGTICIYSSIIYYLRDYIVREISQNIKWIWKCSNVFRFRKNFIFLVFQMYYNYALYLREDQKSEQWSLFYPY